jgi:signal peptidase I
MFLRWLLSRPVRQALQMRKHVWKLLSAQRDLLSAPAIAGIQGAMDALHQTCRQGDTAAVQAGMEELEKAANKWLKPYPSAAWRENIEVLLVAIAVAMGIRTFFLQPFKIPTGSMQPTLYGITPNTPHVLPPDYQIPNPIARFFDFWINGVSFVHVVAKADGELKAALPPRRMVLFNLWQRFQVGDEWYFVWFPPEGMLWRAGLAAQGPDNAPHLHRVSFKAGQDIIKLRVVSGDHLFVDRFTYNFRRPYRGDIVVFETKHIHDARVPQDQYYIKRLVGLGGETVKINTENRLVVNGQPLSADTPGFEKLYGNAPGYNGHAATELFQDGREFAVPQNSYLVMGDNTMNSLDSRYWGAVPREDVIGKAFFVYWPFGSANGRSGHFGVARK